MFGVDIDVFPPDVDGVVVDMIGVYVLEVVVVDAIGADVEVDVFDSVEIVDFGGVILFVSDITVIGFITFDSKDVDVVSIGVDVSDVVWIDLVKFVVGVDLLLTVLGGATALLSLISS